MSAGDLPVLISSPKVARVFEHWRHARGTRLMPMWQEIRPDEIKAELPIVWSYRYDAVQDEFLGGIAGDAIQRLLGGPTKNVALRTVQGEDTHLFCRAKRVLNTPAVFFGRGLLFKQRDRQCYGERLILPFASSSGHAEGIFGVTDYKRAFLDTSGPEASSEVEYWADLKSLGRSRTQGLWENASHLGCEALGVP